MELVHSPSYSMEPPSESSWTGRRHGGEQELSSRSMTRQGHTSLRPLMARTGEIADTSSWCHLLETESQVQWNQPWWNHSHHLHILHRLSQLRLCQCQRHLQRTQKWQPPEVVESLSNHYAIANNWLTMLWMFQNHRDIVWKTAFYQTLHYSVQRH